ncbi:MAG TPA: class I SAM-dependent methyltransferase [Gammaproteobacteria bacterium]|nr:class I SAM-dependent methyltransferase [Gammaproteobacteria bacterium]
MPSAQRANLVPRHMTTQAARADRYDLYQKSVQDVKWEMEFLEGVFHKRRGRPPLLLREDFCGTALAACEWVRRDRRHHAIGVDLDEGVLAWSSGHNLTKLAPSAAARITLLQADVLTANTAPVDLLLAFNFSYWVFKERAVLRSYFQQAHRHLAPDGLFMLDAYGGYDAFRVMRERQDFGRFTYIWEQAEYEPVSGHTTCHIHFAFPDGSRLKRAFSYHWRFWTLPELREVLLEAGFSSVTVYLEGVDEKRGEGNGIFTPAERGDADAAWIAYIVAEP